MLNLNDTRFFCAFTSYHVEDAKAFSAKKPCVFYIELSVHFDEFLRKIN